MSIPNDATHRDAGGCILKWSGAQWQQWQEANRFWFVIGDHNVNRPLTEIKQPAPDWTGEGLPPVGTVCELSFKGCAQGIVTVLYISEEFCVCRSHEHNHEQGSVTEHYFFRPIRTPEQIAADEREAGIQSILDDYTHTIGVATYRLSRSQAERLYKIGYRKV